VRGGALASKDVYAIGSGAKTFVARAKGTTSVRHANPEGLNGLFGVAGLLASFLGDEAISGGELDDGWGAGFEVVVFTSGQFKKVSSMTFATWRKQGANLLLHSLVKIRILAERPHCWLGDDEGGASTVWSAWRARKVGRPIRSHLARLRLGRCVPHVLRRA
jgi:hypothetical protein